MQSNFKLFFTENGKEKVAKVDTIKELHEWKELLKTEHGNEESYFQYKGSNEKKYLHILTN